MEKALPTAAIVLTLSNVDPMAHNLGVTDHRSIIVIPYRMKIYTEYNLAPYLRFVKFMELNINDFSFLNFNSISYH